MVREGNADSILHGRLRGGKCHRGDQVLRVANERNVNRGI